MPDTIRKLIEQDWYDGLQHSALVWHEQDGLEREFDFGDSKFVLYAHAEVPHWEWLTYDLRLNTWVSTDTVVVVGLLKYKLRELYG